MGTLAGFIAERLWQLQHTLQQADPAWWLVAFLTAWQLVGAWLIWQLVRQRDPTLVLQLLLLLAVSACALLVSDPQHGWTLLVVPNALALVSGRSPLAPLRWLCRILWLGSGLACIVLGDVEVAGVLLCGLLGWCAGYISRQLGPWEGARLEGATR